MQLSSDTFERGTCVFAPQTGHNNIPLLSYVIKLTVCAYGTSLSASYVDICINTLSCFQKRCRIHPLTYIFSLRKYSSQMQHINRTNAKTEVMSLLYAVMLHYNYKILFKKLFSLVSNTYSDFLHSEDMHFYLIFCRFNNLLLCFILLFCFLNEHMHLYIFIRHFDTALCSVVSIFSVVYNSKSFI